MNMTVIMRRTTTTTTMVTIKRYDANSWFIIIVAVYWIFVLLRFLQGESKTFKERLQVIQEATLTVQNSIGFLASIVESIKKYTALETLIFLIIRITQSFSFLLVPSISVCRFFPIWPLFYCWLDLLYFTPSHYDTSSSPGVLTSSRASYCVLIAFPTTKLSISLAESLMMSNWYDWKPHV